MTESFMNETSENREIPDVNNSDYNTLVLGFPDAIAGLSGTAFALSAELPPFFDEIYDGLFACSCSGAGILVALMNSKDWRGLLLNFWALSRSSLLLGKDPVDRTPLDLLDRIDSPIWATESLIELADRSLLFLEDLECIEPFKLLWMLALYWFLSIMIF